jgi:mannose-6-phosphate isomerase-like protein (cupin superfamily)
MTRRTDLTFQGVFEVVLETPGAQAAQMTLPPGGSTGGPDNRHAASDQWLFVVSGTGEAVIEGRSVSLNAHTLVVIEAGEAHEIRCTGDEPLRTLSLYVPPEY